MLETVDFSVTLRSSLTPAEQMHACFPIQPSIWNHSPFSGHTPFPVIPAHPLMSYLLSKSASFLSCLLPELVVECLDQGGCQCSKKDYQGQNYQSKNVSKQENVGGPEPRKGSS